MLPGVDGFEVCRRLRDQKRRMPLLFLTALGEVEQRITGLILGADDYLTKPFVFREFEARVRALLRRAHEEKTTSCALDITLDTKTHMVTRGTLQFPFPVKNMPSWNSYNGASSSSFEP